MKELFLAVAVKVRDHIALEMDVVRAKRKVSFFHIMTKCVLVVEGVKVFLDDEVVLAYTGARSSVPNACAFQDGQIVINSAAKELPSQVFDALIQHELAHIKKAHKPNPVLYPAQAILGFGYGLQMEYEADEYALAKGTRVVELLETLIEQNGSTRTLRLRLARAKALSNAV